MFCHFNLLRNVFVYFAFWFAVIDFAIAYDIIDARNEFNNYLYDKSISYIQTEAGKGDAMAIGLLGKAYFEGRFFGKDYEKAYSLLNDGVNRGDLESYKSLGNLRLQKGKYNDPLEALRLFEYAADKGYCIANNNIGRLYLKGTSKFTDSTQIEVNYEKAREWLQKGIDCGAMVSNKWMGDIYEHGLGVVSDSGKATDYYLKAARGGVPEAQFIIGKRYESGYVLEKNTTEAMIWLERARDNKNGDGNTYFNRDLAVLEIAALYQSTSENFSESIKRVTVNAEPLFATTNDEAKRNTGEKNNTEKQFWSWIFNAYPVNNPALPAGVRQSGELRLDKVDGKFSISYNGPFDSLCVRNIVTSKVERFNDLIVLSSSNSVAGCERRSFIYTDGNKGYFQYIKDGKWVDDEKDRWLLSKDSNTKLMDLLQSLPDIKIAVETLPLALRGIGSTISSTSANPLQQSTVKESNTSTILSPSVIVQAESETVYANRKALIIGNESYKSVTKLLTAKEDAISMAEGLKKVGYQVTLKTDLDMQGMKLAIRTFKSQIEGGDEVAIYYAGHGVQLSNTNFLLPIDINGDSEEQIKDDAIPLQRLLDDIADKHAKFTLAMIDACRDNPFKGANGRSIGGTRGLSPTSAATGQMIVFSAGTGQQALDRLGPSDKDKNGVFTRVFLKKLDTQGVSIDKLVRNVRTEVVGLAKSVGHEQVPAIYDQVVGEFYFKK